MRVLLSTVMLSVLPVTALAQEVDFHGYADFRLVAPSTEQSWMKGGLGKLRFDRLNGQDVEPRLGEIVGEARAQLTPALSGFASLRYEDTQRTAIDILEAYLRYRPVSTARWRWSAKLGAFFPPISLENDEIGWTSPWTLTPSAINTWVGEELKAIGAEGKLEWRYDRGSVEAVASIYGWNDPAGILIDDRGWALHDKPTGLLDRPRLPDVVAFKRYGAPHETLMFKEIDDRPGWYAGASWNDERFGGLHLLRYDNEADPSAFRELFAWRTAFWSLGVEKEIGEFVVLMQGMTGETEVAPLADLSILTHFRSAYVLGGWSRGDWRLAGRVDVFETVQQEDEGEGYYTEDEGSEDGYALTFAATWSPKSWLRVTGEALHVNSRRPDRIEEGAKPGAAETQAQLSLRFYL